MSTLKDSARAAAGQVFYYNPLWSIYGKGKEPKGILHNGALEFKTRPHMVTSTDVGNYSSSLCNLVPITTRDEIAIPVQVKFSFEERNQVILTEQPLTANIKDLGEYLYTVSDSILNQFKRGAAIQFNIGMQTSGIALDRLTCRLEEIVDKVIEDSKKKVDTISASQIDDLAIRLGSAVDGLLSDHENKISVKAPAVEATPFVSKPYAKELAECKKYYEHTSGSSPVSAPLASQSNIKPVTRKPDIIMPLPSNTMSPVDKFNKRYNLNPTNVSPEVKKVEIPESYTNGHKPKWSLELQKQFLTDCDTLTPDQIMDRYHLKNKQAVFNHKYLIKNRLGL